MYNDGCSTTRDGHTIFEYKSSGIVQDTLHLVIELVVAPADLEMELLLRQLNVITSYDSNSSFS